MSHLSYWLSSASLPRFPPVADDLEVDVAVIGGGLTGITTAYLLKKEGKRVALLERDRCASVDTGHTTAHCTAVTDLRLYEMESRFGRDVAAAVWDAGMAAIEQISACIEYEQIACDFRRVPGYLHSALDEELDSKIDFDREGKLASELGIEMRQADKVPLFDRPGIEFENQAFFHPTKYLAALVARIPGDGSHVFEQSDASEVESSPLCIKVNGRRVSCGAVVMATHNPLVGIASSLGATLFQTKLALYTSYAVSGHVPPGRLPEGLFWDTSDPYYYLRIEKRRGYDYLIFGGQDHKTGQETDTTDRYRQLERLLHAYVPDAKFDFQWSGQVIETNDGLPYIGELTENQYGATGFAGNGMTFGTLGAMVMTDLILKRRNPWAELFSPSRKSLVKGAWNYMAENKDFAYYFIRDRLARADRDFSDLSLGEGKILSLDGRKVAAYRDHEGAVSLCSAVCTHLKCIVRWNRAEKTWDCPCHGSRFKPTGEVISGPAEEPLTRIESPISAEAAHH